MAVEVRVGGEDDIPLVESCLRLLLRPGLISCYDDPHSHHSTGMDVKKFEVEDLAYGSGRHLQVL
jgi:hypothetical protein